MRIAGSLWSAPPEHQRPMLARAVTSGLPVVHWDASDGEFASAGGFDPSSASDLVDGLAVESEAHLMMNDPGPQLAAWAEFCTTIIVPLEIEQAISLIDRIAALGAQPAVAVSLQTPLDLVPPDLPVLLMSIVPGTAGSPFDPAVLPRVAELRDRRQNRVLGVDGGIGPAQYAGLAQAGANWLVSGTSLFSAPSPSDWLTACQAAFGSRANHRETPAANRVDSPTSAAKEQ